MPVPERGRRRWNAKAATQTKRVQHRLIGTGGGSMLRDYWAPRFFLAMQSGANNISLRLWSESTRNRLSV
jgi:hypothetical protein